LHLLLLLRCGLWLLLIAPAWSKATWHRSLRGVNHRLYARVRAGLAVVIW